MFVQQQRWSQTGRRPAATRWKWVRLPPAFLPGKRPVPPGPRRARPVARRLVGRVPCRESKPGRGRVVVAQRKEHQVFNLAVTGSNPVHSRSRLLTDPTRSTTLKPSRPLGLKGTGCRSGQPSLDSMRLPVAKDRWGQRERTPCSTQIPPPFAASERSSWRTVTSWASTLPVRSRLPGSRTDDEGGSSEAPRPDA